jgi:hypothetical protein
MVSRELAVPYARERFEGHGARLRRALAEGAGARVDKLRNLASGVGCQEGLDKRIRSRI